MLRRRGTILALGAGEHRNPNPNIQSPMVKHLVVLAVAAVTLAACSSDATGPRVPQPQSALAPGNGNGNSGNGGNPHWTYQTCTSSDNTETCDFQLAGLGNASSILVTLSQAWSLTYSCHSPNNGHGVGHEFAPVTVSGVATASYAVTKNGSVTGTLSVTPQMSADDECKQANHNTSYYAVNIAATVVGPPDLSALVTYPNASTKTF
jgi:hypothetical protein